MMNLTDRETTVELVAPTEFRRARITWPLDARFRIGEELPEEADKRGEVLERARQKFAARMTGRLGDWFATLKQAATRVPFVAEVTSDVYLSDSSNPWVTHYVRVHVTLTAVTGLVTVEQMEALAKVVGKNSEAYHPTFYGVMPSGEVWKRVFEANSPASGSPVVSQAPQSSSNASWSLAPEFSESTVWLN